MYNGHADVTALIDNTGVVQASYYYDAFGTPIDEYTNENGKSNPIRYAGYQYDGETDLYYLNARYYDSKIARFLSEDTFSGYAADPLSLNLYTYCHNNPIKYFDPTGHTPQNSIVDYLNSKNQNSSYSARKGIAKELGIQNYSGTAAQNTQMLKTLQEKDKRSLKPTTSSGNKGSTPSGSTPNTTSKGGTVSKPGTSSSKQGSAATIQVPQPEDKKKSTTDFIDKDTIKSDATNDIREQIDNVINEQHQFLIFDAYYDYNKGSFSTCYYQKYIDASCSYGNFIITSFAINTAYNTVNNLDSCNTGEPTSTLIAATVVGAIDSLLIDDSNPGGPGDVLNSIWGDKKARNLAKAKAESVAIDQSEYKYLLKNKNNGFKKDFIKDLENLKSELNEQTLLYGNDAETAYYKQEMLNYIDNVIEINRKENYDNSVKDMETMLKRVDVEVDKKIDNMYK